MRRSSAIVPDDDDMPSDGELVDLVANLAWEPEER